MNYQEKIDGIRQAMKKDGVDAYLIPSSDPHISEYVPERYKCLAFASGFTGSAGCLLITQTDAQLWADFRYFVQAEEQLAGTGYELVKLKVQHAPEYIEWLGQQFPAGSTIGFDAKLISVHLCDLLFEQLSSKSFKFHAADYLDALWENRPELPTAPAFLIDAEHTGATAAQKLAAVREGMDKHSATYHFISALDDVAWLYNLRGNDVSYNPVVLAFALISVDKATLFIAPEKLNDTEISTLLQNGVETAPYHAIGQALAALPAGARILLDPKKTSYGTFKHISDTATIIRNSNPSTLLKAIKNEVEIANTRLAMIQDGVAMTRFFKWMEENIGQINITELSAAQQLEEFRKEQPAFAGKSFNSIAGYRAHGALPHYSATPESDSTLEASGLFLVDSGGQYNYGTTDITRMLALGKPTDEERTDYTLVLKAMIDGSTARFPKGTCGYQIDAITRQPLWEHAINYGHGTGHGVGYYLNVHEGPQVLNPTNVAIPVDLGMITSIEPGIYRPGKHGVRIENLMLTVKDTVNEFGEFYKFETLTLALIDPTPVKKELLERKHLQWLDTYNRIVLEKLSPHLTPAEIQWLQQKCDAFSID
ncbi:aminopeptidase P family protein [Mucilaginibacter galii]|uniref:Xaa-Pro aminopeptidase n=1 Tax=Mucilaginibacter galii TaxID=2005073 RepID=A0A917N4L4_9SPHI|nr:aminopeptidase P family protein [Mucilaginibacter galii]GGI52252.1 Xaa-Pro aminopeptidase [Mucilaginibacter galii]